MDAGDEEGEVGARDGGCEAGADDAERGDLDRAPAVTVDENPVEEDVAEVRGDEGEGDGADVIEGLQVAAEGEVEEEGWCSPVEGVEEADGAFHDLRVDGHAAHADRGELDEAEENRCEDGREDEAVVEPAVRFFEATGSVGLREVGIEREQDAGDAEGQGVVEDLAEGGGGDVDGRVRHVADHDGVDDAHGHPAELGGDERESEGEDGPDLLPY